MGGGKMVCDVWDGMGWGCKGGALYTSLRTGRLNQFFGLARLAPLSLACNAANPPGCSTVLAGLPGLVGLAFRTRNVDCPAAVLDSAYGSSYSAGLAASVCARSHDCCSAGGGRVFPRDFSVRCEVYVDAGDRFAPCWRPCSLTSPPPAPCATAVPYDGNRECPGSNAANELGPTRGLIASVGGY